MTNMIFVRNFYKIKRNNKMSKFDGEFYNKEAQEAVEKVCKEVERLRKENAKLREQLGEDKNGIEIKCANCHYQSESIGQCLAEVK